MRRLFPIFLCLTLLLSGCVQELVFRGDRCIAISVVCSDADLIQTKATKPGEDEYKENLVNTIDYFFYPLTNENIVGDDPSLSKPNSNVSACYHKRETSLDWTYSNTPHTLNLIVTLDQLNGTFFPNTDYVYVLAIANYPGGSSLSSPTLKELSESEYITDFAKMDVKNQTAFLMSGSAVLHLDSRDIYEVNKLSGHEIGLERHAAKFTVSLNIPKNGVSLDGGTWKPMLQGMEVFLCNGVNTVRLDGSMDTDPTSYFNYKRSSRTFWERENQASNSQVRYFDTHPMYSYPHAWVCGNEDVNTTDAEPYLKIIVPWYREEVNSGQTQISFAQRQCYYKVMLPSSEENNVFKGKVERNNWYHFDVALTFLGALIDEDAVKIEGTCFVGTWQNQSSITTHLAEVGTARFLNVEREYVEIHNIEQTQIYYVSSNPAQIIDKSTFVGDEVSIDTVRATRLYYGKTQGTVAGVKLNDTVDIRVIDRDNDIYPKGSQYLEYKTAERWLALGSNDQGTYVYLNHKLNNKYTDKNFDYSPYLITFTLKHKDRKSGAGIEKTVSIVQYPAIYLDCIPNSDRSYATTAAGAAEENKTFFVATANGTKSPTSTYWGYVFVDGGAYVPTTGDGTYNDNTTYKFVSSVNHTKSGNTYLDTEAPSEPKKYNARQWRRNENSDIYSKLKTDPEKAELQWRAVWYTGGSLDLYRINVSVLFDDSFIIGDPRSTVVNNLGYEFTGGAKLLPRENKGFAVAPALYGESPRSLRYYYPTEASSRTEKMLAPSYRVSSKFSGIEFGNMTKEFAEYRCAAYQEDGFPAGRWRLATKGEIHFIAQLSANGVFYTLFNDGGTYWSANGAVKISGSNVLDINTSTAMLRCVYDTWYWGDDQTEYDEWSKQQFPNDWGTQEQRNHFVWGDKPREKQQ